MKRLLFGVPATGSRSVDIGLLILRLLAGPALIVGHGLGKLPPSEGLIRQAAGMGFPAPVLFAWVATFAEVGAPILIMLGLLTRPLAALHVVHFLIVYLVVHSGDTFSQREKPLLFLMVALTLLFTGPGRISLDAMLGRNAGARRR